MSAGTRTAIEYADRLALVLDEEFQSLSDDDIDGFEKLQPLKAELLATLGAYIQTITQQNDGSHPPAEKEPAWQFFMGRMQACRDGHQRNEILIRSRLEAIRNTLRILQNSSETDGALQLYDRLGRVSEGYARKRYTDA